MTLHERSKSGALLCSSTVTSYGLWQKPCWGSILTSQWTSLVAQTVKRLPTMWDCTRDWTLVQSLGHEDLLEMEMAPHSSTLAWKVPWTEEPGRLQTMGSPRVGHNWVTSLSFLSLFLSNSLTLRIPLTPIILLKILDFRIRKLKCKFLSWRYMCKTKTYSVSSWVKGNNDPCFTGLLYIVHESFVSQWW